MSDQLTTIAPKWEMAKALAASEMVPATFRNKPADCMIAVEMAERTGFMPMAVLQNIYIVHGKPAWAATFVIACVNACGKYPKGLMFEIDKEKLTCYAWTIDKDGDRIEGPLVSMAMAKAEGWEGKAGSKWKTMPAVMLQYRAATFFAKMYCPELMMGLRTADEVEDIDANERTMRNVTPRGTIAAEDGKDYLGAE